MNKIENENDITMTHIKGNWRYKIFRFKGKTYILDGSTYWFSFLLVLTKWIKLPIKAYEINDVLIEDLKEEVSAQGINLSWNILLIIIFVSSMVAKLFNKMINEIYLGEKFNIVYVYMIPIIFLSYFTMSRHIKKKEITRLLNGYYDEKIIRFKINPEKKIGKDFLVPLLSLIIFILVISVFAIRNIITKNSDVRDYLMYFLVFLAWFVLGMSGIMRPEYLVGATVIIEDKERK